MIERDITQCLMLPWRSLVLFSAFGYVDYDPLKTREDSYRQQLMKNAIRMGYALNPDRNVPEITEQISDFLIYSFITKKTEMLTLDKNGDTLIKFIDVRRPFLTGIYRFGLYRLTVEDDKLVSVVPGMFDESLRICKELTRGLPLIWYPDGTGPLSKRYDIQEILEEHRANKVKN